MSFTKLPYDNTKLDAIRIRLENHARLNDPIFYSVVIDDLEVIPRTTDASVFTTIDELIGPNTKYVSISEYIGNTRNRKTACFMLDATKSTEQTVLQGIDPNGEDRQQAISKQIELATLQKDYSLLQTEHNKLKQVSEALLDKCDKLEEENTELKKLQDESSQQSSILTFASEILERLVPAKPGNPLSGTPESNNNPSSGSGKDEGQMVAVSEEEYKNYQYFVEQFKDFDQAQKGLLSKMLDLFVEKPEMIEEIFVTAFQKFHDGNQKD